MWCCAINMSRRFGALAVLLSALVVLFSGRINRAAEGQSSSAEPNQPAAAENKNGSDSKSDTPANAVAPAKSDTPANAGADSKAGKEAPKADSEAKTATSSKASSETKTAFDSKADATPAVDGTKGSP